MSTAWMTVRGMRDKQDAKPGMTPVEATAFLHEEFPDIPHWSYVHMAHHPGVSAMAKIVGNGDRFLANTPCAAHASPNP